MKSCYHPEYIKWRSQLTEIVENFERGGEVFASGRNTIKCFELNGTQLNVKSFRKPNFINAFVYRFFRKSKAARSFGHAQYLLGKNIGTPSPVAYFEKFGLFGLRQSYYVSEQMTPDLRFRDLVLSEVPDSESILRQYAAFAYHLHESGIEFIDNTSGNTLIKKAGDRYEFYLVDLNRMNFHKQPLPFGLRMTNLGKLTANDRILRIMADEYAKLAGKPPEEVSEMLTASAQRFVSRFERKRRIKQLILGRAV